MAPYKFILAYDGTDYSGFQRQGKERTVQGVLEDTLRELGWTENPSFSRDAPMQVCTPLGR